MEFKFECGRKLIIVISLLSVLIFVYHLHDYNRNFVDLNVIPELDTSLPPVPSQEWIQREMLRSMEMLGYQYPVSNNWECLQPRHTYFFPQIRAIFTGIPKSGCSNWIEFLLRAEGGLPEKLDPTEVYKIHTTYSEPYRMFREVKDRANCAEQQEHVFSFAVVRNPWTRLVSGYRDKLSAEVTQGRSFGPLTRKIVRKMNKIDNISNNTEHPTFNQYLRWVVLQDNLQNDHFTPQHLTLCIPNVKYDYIIPLELSTFLTPTIVETLKLNTSQSLLGPYNSQSSDPRLQSTTLLAKKWLSEQDPVLIEQLYVIFREDFAMMNYSNFTSADFPLPLVNEKHSLQT